MANVAQTTAMIEACFRHNVIPMMVSPKGCGKTSIPEQLAQKWGWQFLALQMSQMEPPDFVGLPTFPDHLMVEIDGKVGRVHSLDSATDRAAVVFGDALRLYNMRDLKVTSFEPTTKHIRPDFFPEPNAKTNGIILLDELNRSRPDTRAAVFDFLLYRRIVKYYLPEGWHLICAMNPALDGYQVEELDEALIDRLAFIRFEPTVSDWLNYEQTYGAGAKSVMDFIRKHPQHLDPKTEHFDLHKTPSRRSFSTISRMEMDSQIPDGIKLELYSGIVGAVAATAYINSVTRESVATLSWADFRKSSQKSLDYLAQLIKEKKLTTLKEVLGVLQVSLAAHEDLGDADVSILCKLLDLGGAATDLMFTFMRELVLGLRSKAELKNSLTVLRNNRELHDKMREVLYA
jgi:hypothetical protein